MNYTLLSVLLSISLLTSAQDKISFSASRCLVVDSKNNVFVGIRDKLVKVSPDGKATVVLDGRKNFIKNLTVGIDYMAIDTQDNLYVIASRDNLIRKITPDGKITRLGGQPYTYRVIDGPLATANFRSLDHITIDRAGNLYVLDADEETEKTNLTYHRFVIRRLDANGTVTTLNDAATRQRIALKRIEGLSVDVSGDLFISDLDGRCIKRITLMGVNTATVTVVAGLCGKREFNPVYTPGNVRTAELFTPGPIAFSAKGDLIFADVRLHRLIKIANNTVSTVAGNSVIQRGVNMGGRATEGYKDGPALQALFNFPLGVALAYDKKGTLFIIDGGNNCIRTLSPEGIVATFIK